ncbi:MAG TPA: Ldh family oxidoreductase [Xanthobacteraceae bacterium]|nr:Ldh family oxidoreductase [Xanthobacteraceae bacterium]
MAEPTRIYGARIVQFILDCLKPLGLSGADAMKVAMLMYYADLAGADAHGVFRLPQYVKRIKAGGINPKPNITVQKTAPATAMVDGDNGMGHLVMARVVETATALAKETGVAWVGAHRSNHAGAAGVYAEMALDHDMVGIYAVVANANHMPMWGGAENLLGTNPIAFAIPAGEEPPVVLDIATTVVSYGTVKSYRLLKKSMPEGWMIDPKTGAPLTDSARSAEGLLLPIGGYKGTGLALVLGLLAGTLNGAAFGRDVIDFNYNDTDACDTGHFFIALDVARFIPIDVFKREIDQQLRDLRNSKRLPGVDAIRLPGEQRARRQDDRKRNGVPIAEEVLAQLDKLASELGVKKLAAP